MTHLFRVPLRAAAVFMGSVGVYALVCSSLHPHPDAAAWALALLTAATGVEGALGRWG